MKAPWFPLYPGDYIRDTLDLSCCEHGCYLLLLMHSWSRGPLPDDLDKLRRISADAPAEVVRYILETYWQRIDVGWVNEKLEDVRQKQEQLHDTYKSRAIKAAEARWNSSGNASGNASSITQASPKQCLSNANQNQSQNQNQNHTQNHLQNHEEAPNGAMSGKPDRKAAERVLSHLNAKTGRQFKFVNGDGKVSKSAELAMARLREHGEAALMAVIDLKCKQWTSDKMSPFLRPATLFGKEKCEQYVGEAAGDNRDRWDRWADGDNVQGHTIEGDCSHE